MSAPNPIDTPELYEGVVLGGLLSPGKVTLSGHDRKVVWDIKNGSAQSGAGMSVKEIPPIEFTASFYLVKDDAEGVDDLAAWPAFHAMINSTVSGKTPKALDVYHPDLSVNDIKSVVKGTVGGVTHDGKGGQTIVVKFQEYRPAVAKGGSPTGSGTKPKKPGTAPDPNAAAKAELARLTKQYQDTPWG